MKSSRLFAIFIIFGILLGLCGCREDPASSPTGETAPSHIHDYHATVIPPTCTQDGYTTHICACGHSFTDTPVAAAGHSWGQWVVTIAPTPLSRGQARRSCDTCGKIEEKILEKSAELH